MVHDSRERFPIPGSEAPSSGWDPVK
jgi:hypothetical protein